MTDDPTCAAVARETGEDPTGTAPHAVSWVAVRAAGPAATRSAADAWRGDPRELLPERVRRAVEAVPGVGLVAMRPTGSAGSGDQADAVAGAAGQERPGGAGTAADVPALLLAGTRPGRTWRRDVAADDAGSVLDALAGDAALLDALARGEDPRVGRSVPDPFVLVATAGDPCSRRDGPAAAAALAGAVPAPAGGRWPWRRGGSARHVAVAESSDLGGARFAPTALLLPWGLVLGGLGPDPARLVEAVRDVLDGRPVVGGYRGRSTYEQPAQVADAAARRHLALLGTSAGPDDIVVDGVDSVSALVPATAGGRRSGPDPREAAGSWRVRLRHTGGRTFRVGLTRLAGDDVRPTVCGAEPTPVDEWVVEVQADPRTGVYLGSGP